MLGTIKRTTMKTTKGCTLPSKQARESVLGQTTRAEKMTLQKALRKKADKKKTICEQMGE